MNFVDTLFIRKFISIPGTNGSKPVSQMLSQSHGANFITFWLKEWLRFNKRPREVITDASEALMSACVQAFAKLPDTNSYISESVKSLLDGDKAPPLVFLRLDRSHFVRSFLLNKQLAKEDPRVRAIVQGTVGYLIQCESLSDAENVLHNLFILTKNQYANRQTQTAENYLKLLIGTHKICETAHAIDKEEDVKKTAVSDDGRREVAQLPASQTYKDTLMYKRVKDIFDSVTNQPAGSEIIHNLFYSDRLNKYLFELFTRLPMWSNIMCKKYGSKNLAATSAPTERFFKTVKHEMGINTRCVDVFVREYLKSISGLMKSALARQETEAMKVETDRNHRSVSLKKKNRSLSTSRVNDVTSTESTLDSSRERSKSESDIHTELIENWRGKAKASSTLHRSKSSILNPHDVNYPYHNIPLMKNGDSDSVPRYKVGRKTVVIEKTCAFDSLYCVYAAAYFDNDVIQKIINDATHDNEFSTFISNIVRRKKKKAKSNRDFDRQLYSERTKLLYTLYSCHYKKSILETEHTLNISCVTAFGPFVEKLILLDGAKLSSKTNTCTCTYCNETNIVQSPLVPVTLSTRAKINLETFSKVIAPEECFSRCKCANCGNEMEVTTEYGSLLAFEIEPLLKNQMEKTQISAIQNEIYMNGQAYKLYAVIEFNDRLEHFLAHIKRKDDVWQTFDDVKKHVKCLKRIETLSMYAFMLFYMKT